MKNVRIMRLSKIILLVVGFLGLVNISQAQQDHQYSMYMFNGLVINPAYAGSREAWSVTGLFRKQWVALDGAPLSASITVHGPSKNERHGFGATVTEDRLGITNMIGLNGYYAYRIPIGRGNLALGLDAGVLNYRNNWNKIDLIDASDAATPTDVQNRFLPLVGAGAYFSTKRFYIGAAMPNVIPNRYTDVGVGLEQNEARQSTHVFATAGVVIPLGDQLDLKPSVLMKYATRAPIEFDINVAILFKKMLWLGVSYRTGDSFVMMAEFNIRQTLRIGYAYDLTLTKLRQVNTGSHEIMLGIDIGRGRDRIITPRYF